MDGKIISRRKRNPIHLRICPLFGSRMMRIDGLSGFFGFVCRMVGLLEYWFSKAGQLQFALTKVFSLSFDSVCEVLGKGNMQGSSTRGAHTIYIATGTQSGQVFS